MKPLAFGLRLLSKAVLNEITKPARITLPEMPAVPPMPSMSNEPPPKIGTVWTARAILFNSDGEAIGTSIDTPNAIAKAMMEYPEVAMVKGIGGYKHREDYSSRMQSWNVASSGFRSAEDSSAYQTRAPMAEVPIAPAKQPWEMTRAEYEKSYGKPKKTTTLTGAYTPHQEAVAIALNQGKAVPPEVLKDYPDLAAKSVSAAPSQKVGTSCIPCSVNHISACSGLLSEALRFARTDGLGSQEVVERIGLCQDEINAMERVDLRPEQLQKLEAGEKKIADDLLIRTRQLRHKLEHMIDVSGLEVLAADMQSLRTDVGRAWWMNKFQSFTPEQQTLIKEKAQRLLSKSLEG